MEISYSIKEHIDPFLYKKLIKLAKVFQQHGYECYLVGGFIRDILLKKSYYFQDIDIATNATPEKVSNIFKKVIPTGIRHGTVTILFEGLTIECTTYRKDFQYSDNRHPDTIQYANNIYEDLSRRDFTINAFAYDILKEFLIDQYEGLKDLQNQTIRCIGDPKKRFLEDGLRPIRACRFRATLHFSLELNTQKAMMDPEVRKSIASISMERFTEELWKGFYSKNTSSMLLCLYESQLLELFIPSSYLKNSFSREFFFYLDCFSSPIFKMSLWFWSQNFSSYQIGKLLRFSNQKIKHIHLYQEFINFFLQHPPVRISSITRNHAHFFLYRKFLGKIKKELQKDYLSFFQEAKEFLIHSHYGFQKKEIHFSKTLISFYKQLLSSLKEDPLIIKDLQVNGNDVMKAGISGMKVGMVLENLLDLVLKNPQNNQREILLKAIEQYITKQ